MKPPPRRPKGTVVRSSFHEADIERGIGEPLGCSRSVAKKLTPRVTKCPKCPSARAHARARAIAVALGETPTAIQGACRRRSWSRFASMGRRRCSRSIAGSRSPRRRSAGPAKGRGGRYRPEPEPADRRISRQRVSRLARARPGVPGRRAGAARTRPPVCTPMVTFHARGEHDNTVLHFADGYATDAGILDKLIDTGADINARNDNRTFPLHYAVGFNDDPGRARGNSPGTSAISLGGTRRGSASVLRSTCRLYVWYGRG